MSDNTQMPWLNAYPQGIAWDQPFEPRPVPKILQDAVSRYGPQPCTNFLGKKLTYNEIGALVDRALDIVLGHRLALGVLHRQTQARIALNIRSTHFGGDGDLFGQL